MKKMLIALCMIFNVIITALAVQLGVAFDRPTVSMGRTRLQAVANFNEKNKNKCPGTAKSINRLSGVDATRDGRGYAVTQATKDKCDAEAAKKGM